VVQNGRGPVRDSQVSTASCSLLVVQCFLIHPPCKSDEPIILLDCWVMLDQPPQPLSWNDPSCTSRSSPPWQCSERRHKVLPTVAMPVRGATRSDFETHALNAREGSGTTCAISTTNAPVPP
jgi:hypothetical protein